MNSYKIEYIIDKIKTENFDKAVDEIFTENRIIIRRV